MATHITAWKGSRGLDVCKDKDSPFPLRESHMNVVLLNFSVSIDSCSLHYIFIHLLLPLIDCPKNFHLGLRSFT